MVAEDNKKLICPSREIETARASLLDKQAVSLLNHVRSALCEPTRSQIASVLRAGPISVNDLASVIQRTKWATSQHLRVLRRNGLVVSQRRGRSVFYTLSDTPAAQAIHEALVIVTRAASA